MTDDKNQFLDGLEQNDGMATSYPKTKSRRGDVLIEDTVFMDGDDSPIDPPTISTPTDSERSSESATKMVSKMCLWPSHVQLLSGFSVPNTYWRYSDGVHRIVHLNGLSGNAKRDISRASK